MATDGCVVRAVTGEPAEDAPGAGSGLKGEPWWGGAAWGLGAASAGYGMPAAVNPVHAVKSKQNRSLVRIKATGGLPSPVGPV